MVSHFACNGRSHGGGHRPATGVCGSFPSRPKSVQLHLLLSSGAITQRRMMKKKKEEEGWRNKKWFKEKRGEREKEREKKRIFIDKFWSVSEKKKSYFKRRNLSLSLLLLSRSHSLVFDRWKNRKERGELSAILNFHPRHVLLDMYRDSIRETRLCLQCPLEIGGGRGG